MKTIAINNIRLDGGTQPRAAISNEVVADYAVHMADGDKFPPITVFYDGERYWCADGFHRIHASKRVGFTEIDADVKQGTVRNAILYSVAANRTHGLRRTNADKKRGVLALLNDSEWTKWSDRKIADACGVSQPFVSELRPKPSDNGYQTQRTFERGGKTHTMKTDSINAGRKSVTCQPNMPTTTSNETEPANGSKPRKKNRMGKKEEYLDIKDHDPAFATAWENIFREVKNAKAEKWATVPKHVAQKYIQILLDVITL